MTSENALPPPARVGGPTTNHPSERAPPHEENSTDDRRGDFGRRCRRRRRGFRLPVSVASCCSDVDVAGAAAVGVNNDGDILIIVATPRGASFDLLPTRPTTAHRPFSPRRRRRRRRTTTFVRSRDIDVVVDDVHPVGSGGAAQELGGELRPPGHVRGGARTHKRAPIGQAAGTVGQPTEDRAREVLAQRGDDTIEK